MIDTRGRVTWLEVSREHWIEVPCYHKIQDINHYNQSVNRDRSSSCCSILVCVCLKSNGRGGSRANPVWRHIQHTSIHQGDRQTTRTTFISITLLLTPLRLTRFPYNTLAANTYNTCATSLPNCILATSPSWLMLKQSTSPNSSSSL
jgi:hypothetical protein